MPRRLLLIGALLGAPVAALGDSATGAPLVVQLDAGDAQGWAGFARAQVAGYYAEAGLRVTLRAPDPDGEAPTAALARGLADVALDWTGPALEARAQGLAVVQIATPRPAAALSLLCRRDLGVDEAAALPGKTVATWPGARQAPLRRWLADHGIDPARVEMIPQPAAGLLPLSDSRAHCQTVSGPPAGTIAAAGLAPERLAILPLAPEAAPAGVFVLRAALDEPAQRDRLARFLQASARGWADLAGAQGDWRPSPEEAAATARALPGQPAVPGDFTAPDLAPLPAAAVNPAPATAMPTPG